MPTLPKLAHSGSVSSRAVLREGLPGRTRICRFPRSLRRSTDSKRVNFSPLRDTGLWPGSGQCRHGPEARCHVKNSHALGITHHSTSHDAGGHVCVCVCVQIPTTNRSIPLGHWSLGFCWSLGLGHSNAVGDMLGSHAHPHQTLERPARAGRWFPAAGHALPAARSQQSRRNMGSVDPETRPKQRASCRGLHDERIADCVANVPGPVHRGAAGESGNHSGACATGQSRRDDHAALFIRVRAGVAVPSVDPARADRAGGRCPDSVRKRITNLHESSRMNTNENEIKESLF